MANVKGRALDMLLAEPADIKTIKDTLKAKIKPEKSTIIEGRMAALRADKSSVSDFVRQTEKLADQLKRSYIEEGMTSAKANEMAVDKAIAWNSVK